MQFSLLLALYFDKTRELAKITDMVHTYVVVLGASQGHLWQSELVPLVALP